MIPNIWKNKNVPNHQPVLFFVYRKKGWSSMNRDLNTEDSQTWDKNKKTIPHISYIS
jgi:hypothetical protein